MTTTGANSYTGSSSFIADFKIICAGNTLTTDVINTTTFLADKDPKSSKEDYVSVKSPLIVTIEDCIGLTKSTKSAN